jgi:hypothetical protein
MAVSSATASGTARTTATSHATGEGKPSAVAHGGVKADPCRDADDRAGQCGQELGRGEPGRELPWVVRLCRRAAVGAGSAGIRVRGRETGWSGTQFTMR